MIKPSLRVQNLDAYSITSQDIWQEDFNSEIIKADWNEAPRNLSIFKEKIIEIVQHNGILAWYPDYNCEDLLKGIKNYTGCHINQISIHSGTDSALSDIANCYLDPNDGVLILSPTYDNFRVYAKQHGGKIFEFDINQDGTINYLELKKVISDLKPKLVYMVNPNNPFGTHIEHQSVLKLLKEFTSSLFIVDEAYIDFKLNKTIASEISNYKNLLVTRTFSKAFGLAGLRIGYVLADKNIIDTIKKIRKGKNVSMIGQKLAGHALENIDFFLEWFDEIEESKKLLYEFFDDKKISYIRSEANFILFFAEDAKKLCSSLESNGVYMRNRESIVSKSIRVTVGSKTDAIRLLDFFNSHLSLFFSKEEEI